MRQTDLPTLKQQILQVARQSGAGEHLRDISVEADRTEDGGDFLRVVVEIDTVNSVDDETLEQLIATIEQVVSGVDERFLSIRFAEAA